MKVQVDNGQRQEVTEERRNAESMALVLVWLLVEFAQQYYGPQSSLWKGSYVFFLAWLCLSTPKTSLLRWMGLPVISFLIWFPSSISQALIHSTLVGALFLLFYRWMEKEWKFNASSILKSLGLLLGLSVLRVALNQSLTMEYPLSDNGWTNLLDLWLPAIALHAVDLIASLPFYALVLIPLLQIAFTAEKDREFSWNQLALGLVALGFWVLALTHWSIPFSSPWLWIVTLLLASWAGTRGVLTAIYGAYVMNFAEINETRELYNDIWQLMGLAALAFLFSFLAFRERNKLKVENALLEQQMRHLQEKLFFEEQQNQSLTTRIDSMQRLVLRSIQEMHAYLTPIVLSSKLISQQALAEKEGVVRILQSSADKQMQLLQDLQDAIQIPGQGMQGQPQRVLVGQMFRQLLPLVADLAASRSVTVTLGQVGPLVAVQSWPQALLESFEHLLRHLILFGEEHSQIVIRVYVQPQKIHLQLRHSNYTNRQGVLAGLVDGNLMSKEALALAVNFDVGLYTACRLLESMGGQLSIFEKAAQHHLAFAVQMPAAKEEELGGEYPVPIALNGDVKLLAKPQQLEMDGHLPPRRLLLVEDDKMTQELLKSILAHSGIEVRSFENAQEAYESFCSFHPDVVIADLGLPDSNGFELIKRLRSVAKYDFYAIAFSANNHRNVLKTALSAGFDSFLPKPLAIHDLCRALRIA